MAWKESDIVSERLEFVKLASCEGANISLLCKRFGVSRKTGYKWIKRWHEQGDAALSDRSRRPEHSPGKTDEATEQAVLAMRGEHPAWGGRKIRRRLEKLGREGVPAPSTITKILHRHALISDEESAKHRAFTKWQRDEPNDLWQMDFKGEFKTLDSRYCYPLTILDDHSRYSLCVRACENQRRVTVRAHLIDVFDRYGTPRAIYVDNGNPWGTPHADARHTRLSAWLMRHEIRVIHGKPYYPQGRGKLERFHRTLKLELLQGRTLDDASAAQRAFTPWRSMYNQERPHEALDLDVPADRYCPSSRTFRERTEPYEYSARFEVRKTAQCGQISFHGKQYSISEAFASQPLGLCPTAEDGVLDVYYCWFTIGQLDLREGRFRRRKRLE